MGSVSRDPDHKMGGLRAESLEGTLLGRTSFHGKHFRVS